MEVRIDGSRSTSDNWVRATLAPDADLPKLTNEEQSTASKLGLAEGDYARSQYAIHLTDVELRDKAVILAKFVEGWLDEHHISASVNSIWLKTLEGKYRLELVSDAKSSLIFINEALVDKMLEEGSTRAKTSLANILEMNLLPMQMARVS
ncbi:MAG: hypothetical protein M3R43_00235 [Acidobacteriota bacterium]|nr:hypothetical protein [Acidobacteriota bacterium]